MGTVFRGQVFALSSIISEAFSDLLRAFLPPALIHVSPCPPHVFLIIPGALRYRANYPRTFQSRLLPLSPTSR